MSLRRGFTLAVFGTLVWSVASGQTPSGTTPPADPAVAGDLARLRTATAPFRDIAAAQAAGYPTATPQCLASPTDGTMGHHYVNRAHVDGTLELEHPEILLYVPDGDGKMKLVAVEYIIPYRILPPESEAPRIFGQALLKSEGLKLWYLHVWAWEENPKGLFADWNPAIKCNPGM